MTKNKNLSKEQTENKQITFTFYILIVSALAVMLLIADSFLP